MTCRRTACGKLPRAALWTLSAVYGALMIWLLFLRRRGSFHSMNLVPFATIREFLEAAGGADYLARHAAVNLAGNVVMFVPLGFFPPALFPWLRSFRRDMLACAAAIVLVECMQYLLWCGSADVDDLILNLCGAAAGYGLFAAARNLFK